MLLRAVVRGAVFARECAALDPQLLGLMQMPALLLLLCYAKQ